MTKPTRFQRFMRGALLPLPCVRWLLLRLIRADRAANRQRHADFIRSRRAARR